MKLDLNKPILDLEGNPIKNGNEVLTIGKQIASALVGSNKGEALKFYDWAVKLYKGEALEVDKSDLKKITEFVETNEQFTNLLKAQALELLDIKEEVKS